MKIALAGNPNSGKTALFNFLTGSRQKVGNYPGVTVEKKEGTAHLGEKNFHILDLPGTYSLDARSIDEQISRDILFGKYENESAPDALMVVADATSLERSLAYVLELRALGKPMVLALNMMDIAEKRGLQLDLEKLQKELQITVIPTVAVKGTGVNRLLEAVEQAVQEKAKPFETLDLKARFQEVDRILKSVTVKQIAPDTWTRKLDAIVLHPVWGTLVLIGILFLLFQSVFQFAGVFQDLIEAGVGGFGAFVAKSLPEGVLRDVIVDGAIAGVGSVVVFLPQILLLFLFVLILEDSGYMARAAFLMDRLMKSAGLQGRAFIPLLSSYACAIPGIMATRTIEDPRDRLTTILIAPLTTCAARLPVYTLLIAAFIPQTTVWGWMSLQGLVLAGLYFLGVASTLGIAFILRKTLLKGKSLPLVFELPSYKRPSLKNLVLGLWERSIIFLRRAGTVIMALSVLLWFLCSYPKAPEGSTDPAIHHSFAGKFGHFIEPVIQPLGFDWRVGIALVPGMAAREVMVASLATVYAVESKDGDEEKLQNDLGTLLAQNWSIATALSLLVWYVFACQCISTLGVTRRETNSYRWPAFMFIYMTVLAYVAAWATYNLAKLWL